MAWAETTIADYLLAECRKRGEILTNLKLQKLLYYAQAWYLVLKGEPLFNEDFRAWVHGPVLLSQYHRFKHHSWRPIMDDIAAPEQLSDLVTNHLDEIIEVFGTETAVALELMTHREKPWIDARAGLAPHEPGASVISKESMVAFYRSL